MIIYDGFILIYRKSAIGIKHDDYEMIAELYLDHHTKKKQRFDESKINFDSYPETLEALKKHCMFVSIATVRTHIENVYRKLQVHNKTAAVEQARKKGIIYHI